MRPPTPCSTLPSTFGGWKNTSRFSPATTGTASSVVHPSTKNFHSAASNETTIVNKNTFSTRYPASASVLSIKNHVKGVKQRIAGVDVLRLPDGTFVPRIDGSALQNILQRDKGAFPALSKVLIECVFFLYREGIKPFAGEIAHQMRKRTDGGSWLPSEVVALAFAAKEVFPRVERRVKGEDGWVIMLKCPFEPKTFSGFIDTRIREDCYSSEQWLAFNRYFIEKMSYIKGNVNMGSFSHAGAAFTEGRYALAERLRLEIPMFQSLQLAHLIRMVQLASWKRLLTYKDKALVPVAACPIAAKEFLQRHSIAAKEKTSVTVNQLLQVLHSIVESEPLGIFLAQLKDLVRWATYERLDCLLLGHTKLQDLLLSEPFTRYYRLYTPHGNEHCTYVQSKIYPLPAGALLHTKCSMDWNPRSCPMDDVQVHISANRCWNFKTLVPVELKCIEKCVCDWSNLQTLLFFQTIKLSEVSEFQRDESIRSSKVNIIATKQNFEYEKNSKGNSLGGACRCGHCDEGESVNLAFMSENDSVIKKNESQKVSTILNLPKNIENMKDNAEKVSINNTFSEFSYETNDLKADTDNDDEVYKRFEEQIINFLDSSTPDSSPSIRLKPNITELSDFNTSTSLDSRNTMSTEFETLIKKYPEGESSFGKSEDIRTESSCWTSLYSSFLQKQSYRQSPKIGQPQMDNKIRAETCLKFHKMTLENTDTYDQFKELNFDHFENEMVSFERYHNDIHLSNDRIIDLIQREHAPITIEKDASQMINTEDGNEMKPFCPKIYVQESLFSHPNNENHMFQYIPNPCLADEFEPTNLSVFEKKGTIQSEMASTLPVKREMESKSVSGGTTESYINHKVYSLKSLSWEGNLDKMKEIHEERKTQSISLEADFTRTEMDKNGRLFIDIFCGGE